MQIKIKNNEIVHQDNWVWGNRENIFQSNSSTGKNAGSIQNENIKLIYLK